MERPDTTPSQVQARTSRLARVLTERDHAAKIIALVTAAGVALALVFIDMHFLMPGPLTSAHGTIQQCSTCHSDSGSGTGTAKLTWVRGLVSAKKHADSKACIACHKMPDTAFNAHGADAGALKRSTERLTPVAAKLSPLPSARAQDAVFPARTMVSRGMECATCHVEHQGGSFKLAKISNAQCQSCHVAKFASFDGGHPEFEEYPFRRRTRIIYDHDGHFGKHYPEVAKKDPAKRIPATCATCHEGHADKRLMAVTPFEKTCGTCHLDQITGKGRASGPKGIAFLTLPGIDVQSLKAKNVAIGDWPDASDAALTPFMRVMITRTERGKAILKEIAGLNLQDLSQAGAERTNAVANLVWEIKSIYRDLISGKASDVLGNLNIAGGAKLSAGLVSDLTASIPRDVLISAQQQWLPRLAAEMASMKVAGDNSGDGWTQIAPLPVVAANAGAEATASGESEGDKSSDPAGDDTKVTESKSDPEDAAPRKPAQNKLDPPACQVRVLGQCLMYKAPPPGSYAPSANDKTQTGAAAKSQLPPAMQAGLRDIASRDPATNSSSERALQVVAANDPPASANKNDELLFPTPEEQREIDASRKGGGKSSARGKAETSGAQVISIESSVDPESWAEYGGWYRQDYAILYSPTGHKDKFIYSWLFLTGPQAAAGDANPAAAVFDLLTAKNAQGACTKCHSIDDLQGKGRIVNFGPISPNDKKGSFTTFAHEPHFGVMEQGGCLTCHKLESGRPYLKSYEQGAPQVAAANFGSVKKEVCQKCHTSTAARQDCQTCHKYHVNGVTTPIINTKLPMQ